MSKIGMIIMSTLTAILTSLLRGNNVIGVEALPDHLYGFFLLAGWKIAKSWALVNLLRSCLLVAKTLRMCVLRDLAVTFLDLTSIFFTFLRVFGLHSL